MSERLDAHKIWTDTCAVLRKVEAMYRDHQVKKDVYPDSSQWEENNQALEELFKRCVRAEFNARNTYMKYQGDADQE